MTDVSPEVADPGLPTGSDHPGSGVGGSGWLVWPLTTLCAVFRPIWFFSSVVRRMSFGVSLTGAILNVALGVGIPLLVIGIASEGLPNDISAVVVLAALGTYAVLVVLSATGLFLSALLLAPAMSGVGSLWQALKRSMAVVSGVSSLCPVLGAAVIMFAVHGEAITDWLRARYGYEWVGLFMANLAMVPALWSLVWLLLGLFLDGRGRGQDDRPRGECRCERCGYDLKIIPEEQVCPECGHPVACSFDPERRAPPPIEDPGGALLPRLAATLWLAFWTPKRFWQRHRVRRDNRRARNAFLAVILWGCCLLSAGHVFCLAVLLSISGEETTGMTVVAGLWMFMSVSAGVLWTNQLVLLIGQAISRVRGNTMRSDELARAGYYALGLPALVEVVAVHLGILFVVLAVWVWIPSVFVGAGTGSERRIAAAVLSGSALVCGLVIVAMGVWSLVSVARSHEACRYANY